MGHERLHGPFGVARTGQTPDTCAERGIAGTEAGEMAEISVITALSGTDHLSQTLRSLEGQTLADWEWVLIPTAGGTLPAELTESPRVRVVDASGLEGGLNGGRVAGVESSSSPLVVFLEEGEVLAPDALALMCGALVDDTTDIVYTDFALFPIDGRPAPNYSADYGWRTGVIEFEGEALRSVEAFEPIPSAVSHGSYAPRHGLAMTKETYGAIGGHDITLSTASTFAMVCSAFIAGKAFTRLPQVLVYTRFAHNVRRDLYLEEAIGNSSRTAILHQWCARNGLSMLDLGAAHNPTPGFVSVDLQDAAINCDIRFGLPLPDDSVGAIRASDFLEHMNTCPDSSCTHGADGVSPRCVVGMMNEFHRVLAPGGLLLTHTPSTDGRGAFQDPTHVSYWNPNSFWYYTRAEQARFVRGITCRFQVARMWQGFPSPWHRDNNLLYVDADLVALKGQNQPGICEI